MPGAACTQEDGWDAIAAYFAKYGLVRHQIESFDAFLLMLVPHIIQETSDIVVREGETIQHVISLCNVSVGRPVSSESDGSVHVLMPHMARLRGLSYECNIFADMVHDIHRHGKHTERRVFREALLCSLPCMVGSSACHTQYRGAGQECRMDEGGYFIVNGVEKCLIAQERLRTNFPFVFELRGNARYALVCEIRSCHWSKLRSTSTLYVYLNRGKPGTMPEIVCELPFVHTKVSLTGLFRLLRVESRRQIVELVTGETNSTEMRLLCTILDYDPVADMTTEQLLEWLGTEATTEPTRERRMRYLEHIESNELLPHVGLSSTAEVRAEKAAFLGLMVRKLLRVHLGEIDPDDRDHYAGKRIDPSGMGLLFRQAYRSQIKAITTQAHRLRDQKKLAFASAQQLIGARRITNTFRYAFATGNWGLGSVRLSSSAQTGVVQMISRMTVVSALASLRRINTPISREGKAPKPRQLHHTSWGVVCCVETPEGASCGLVKSLALLAHIRVGTIDPSEVVVQIRRACGQLLVPGAQMDAAERSEATPVLCNGILLGFVRDAGEALERLRALRRCEAIPFDASVSLVDMAVHVDTDAGCLLRPLIVGERAHLLRGVLAGVAAPQDAWDALLRANVVEYIDKQEEVGLRVGLWCGEVDPARYSHYELHPSMIMGLCAALIPFADRNQAPRNTYQSAMCKQAVSVFSLCHGRRMDTVAHVLCAPQRPLVTTRVELLLGLGDAPTGVNAIVAIMPLGYNQEDSIVFNEDSLQRGMFRTEKYSTTREEERPGGGDCERLQNPAERGAAGLRVGNYDKLRPTGVPDVGTPISAGDAIIGKTMLAASLGGDGAPVGRRSVMRDRSVIHRHGECVVDGVLTSHKPDGSRTVKVKTRETRTPTVGDKFSSRMGQKGVIGRTLKQHEMPYTRDGLVPDIIINPHAIPSRMTLGQLMECLVGRLAAVRGQFADATAFGGASIEAIGDALEAEGYARAGTERMYSAETGRAFEADVFIGPTYYQRLKHMVADKHHARSRGPVQTLTRQPLEGRSRDGGLRFGEMERDCLSEDHQILTDLGFVGLDELLRRLEEREVLVAGYDVDSGCLVYEPMRDIIIKPARKQEMIAVHAHYCVSALVTPTHDMYWKEGDGAYAKGHAERMAPPCSLLARVLAPERPIVGYELAMRALGLEGDAGGRAALAALYGAWIRGGASRVGRALAFPAHRQTTALAARVGRPLKTAVDWLLLDDEVCASLFASNDWPAMLPADAALLVLESMGGSPFWTRADWCRDVAIRLCLHAGLVARCVRSSRSVAYVSSFVDEELACKVDGWMVDFADAEARANPLVRSATREAYSGRTWCVSVGTTMIVTRRAIGDEVTTPIVCGNCIISHGAHHVLLERLMLVSDVFSVWLCGACGQLAVPPAAHAVVRAPRAYCRVCESSRSVVQLHLPFACKLLVQELAAMHIGTQLLTE